MRRSSKVLPLGVLLLAGCGPAPADCPGEPSTCTTTPSTGSSTAATDDKSTPTTAATSADDWPACAPWSAQTSQFVVGDDRWSDPSLDPVKSWPPGHHTATCTVLDTATKPIPDTELANILVRLADCVDLDAQPVTRSLDLVLVGDTLGAPPGVTPGRGVRVHYSIQIFAPAIYQSWYSLRDTTTDQLLLAAFSDPGPAVEPRLPDQPALPDWFAPFTARLGPPVCAPETAHSCGVDTPQRAALLVTRGEQQWQVIGGTAADLGEYRLHLGFAGRPDTCEGLPANNPIEGVLLLRD